MRLAKVHVTSFQSIQDSTEFDVGDVTCLVGKNEAGKTALLKAMYRLKPIVETDGQFDVTDDYPRRAVTDYQDDIDAGRREPAQIIQATYALEPDDIAAVEAVFGKMCLKDKNPTVSLHKGYSNKRTFSGLHVDTEATLKHLIESAGLPETQTTELLNKKTAEAVVGLLAKGEQTEASQKLAPTIQQIAENDVAYVVHNEILCGRIPKFLYFDDYYQMKGQDNVDALKERVASGALEDSDYPLLGLIELARLDLDQLTNPKRTEALLAKLEAAENQLTEKVLAYWSQNRHLRMKFDIRRAQPEDPVGMTKGMNIWGRVNDTKHMVSTALGTRSRGFVWFFSFLAWYSQLRHGVRTKS